MDVHAQGCRAHYNLRIADISEGGCYLDSILELDEGETLQLKILMAGGKWLEMHCVVAHRFPRLGFGVRFIDLNDEQRFQISLLIPQATPILEESREPSLPVEHFSEIALRPVPIDVTCHEIM